MKYTFFIEGGDNVGKTTTINNLQKEEFINKLSILSGIDSIYFTKYPTSNITQYINETNKKLKELINIEDRVKLQNELLSTLLKDMKDSFKNTSKHIINISDRGILSSYLYQYKKHKSNYNVDLDTEALDFFNFISKCVKPIYDYRKSSNVNIIILNNNNPSIELTTDESETIEYKKEYDKDKILQDGINNTIHNIVDLLDISNDFNTSLYNIFNIKIYYVNIYEGDKRKSSDTICNEITDIINSHIYYILTEY